MASERDQSLLHVGQQCSLDSCLIVDFLPFKCQHCQKPFCADHFLVAGHSCPDYDETKHQRIAPDCPMCKVPIAIRPGQDPNARMEEHFATDCAVMTGTVKKKTVPTCARNKCGKVLFAPISCKNCRSQFCPAHRFPQDHNCGKPDLSAANMRPEAPKMDVQAAKKEFAALNARAAAATSSTMDSIKKGLAKASTSSTPSQSKPSTPMPFSKTDRRAKAERESRRRGMMERAKKGLLSEEEKTILAAEEAERASEKDKNDCIVM